MTENNENQQETPPKSAIDTVIGKASNLKNLVLLGLNRLSNFERTNMEIGVKHLKNAQFRDASMRFSWVTLLNKGNAIAHYLHGKANLFMEKRAKAAKSFRKALALKPDLEEATFLLSLCGGPTQNVKSIPRSFIIEKSDVLANDYDNYVSVVTSLVNKTLKEELDKAIPQERIALKVLDLGCRGGDSSTVIRDRSNSITGVDPSLKMTALARNKRIGESLIFNVLATKFPEDFLHTCNEKYDLVISTFYLDNLSDLNNFFSLVTKVVDKGGIFAFNTGDSNMDIEFRIGAVIFFHSQNYIKTVAEKNGFKLVTARKITYSNNATDMLYLVEKL